MEIVPSLLQSFQPAGLTSNADFGEGVAMSLDQSVYLIGAPGESSDVGAAYVFRLTNGTYVETKLTATGGSGTPRFGYSVSLSGDGNTAAIGAPDDSSTGAVYIFDYSGSSWSQTVRLTATGRLGTFGNFGFALDLNLDGTILIAGDYIDGVDPSDDRGSVFFFAKSGTWSQTDFISYPTAGMNWFGFSVAMDAAGTTAIAGAPLANGQVGEAYVYSNDGAGNWTQVGSALTPTGNVGNARFGNAVALNAAGNRAIIGGYFDETQIGAAYVFAEQGGTWSQTGRLVASGLTGAALFGSWVSLNAVGDLALIGAFQDASGDGAAFVYQGAIDANMTQVGSLISPPSTGGEFGVNLALSSTGTSALIGAHFEDSLGATYLYRMMEFPFKSYQAITPSTVTSDARFGNACSMNANGDRLIVGAWNDLSNDGSTFFYEKQNGVWTETQKVNVGDGEFGRSVDMSADGKTVIIGAPEIDTFRGAAYIYGESGGTWTQINQISQPGGTIGDLFGYSVALGLNGTRAIIGATGEDTNDGAMYIYENIANTWTEINRFTPVSGTGTLFGTTVDISEDGQTAAVGTLVIDAVDVYTNYTGVWDYATTINGSGLDNFGRAFAIDDTGTTMVIGAFGVGSDTGQAYIYNGANTSWSLTKTLNPVGAVGASRFGASCDIDSTGTTVAIGATYDDSNQGAAYAFTSSGNWSLLGSKLSPPAGVSSRRMGTAVALDSTASTLMVGTSSNTTVNGSTFAFAYPQTTVTPGFLPLNSDINVAAGFSISAWMNGTNLSPIPNLALTVSGGVTQGQILTNGYGWVSTQPNTSRSVIANDANFSFTTPPKYTTAFLAKTNDSSHATTTIRLLDSEGDAFAYPATIGVDGNWTVATSANAISFTSKNIVETLPYLYLTNDISEQETDALVVEGVADQGVQAFSSSSASQPMNCLAGATLVQLGDGTFRRLDALKCGAVIRTVCPNGAIENCAVDIIRTHLPGQHEAIQVTHGDAAFACSPKHISLVPPQWICDWDALVCAKCGCTGRAYGNQPSCRLCSPVQVKDHVPVLACDLLGGGLVDGTVQTVIHQGYWYHVILPPPKMSHAFILENGILSEGFRHPLGSKQARDKAWKLVV